jgi:hypothetical protein
MCTPCFMVIRLRILLLRRLIYENTSPLLAHRMRERRLCRNWSAGNQFLLAEFSKPTTRLPIKREPRDSYRHSNVAWPRTETVQESMAFNLKRFLKPFCSNQLRGYSANRLPVFGRIIIKGQRRGSIFDQTGHRFRAFRLELFQAVIKSLLGRFPGFRLPVVCKTSLTLGWVALGSFFHSLAVL